MTGHKQRGRMARQASEVGGNFRSALRNRHVSVPGAAAVLCEAAVFVWPARANELRLLAKSLMAYATLAAANTDRR